ncbi:MAG: hypothetical protein RI945_110 [Candidatus Parcubacteria bacterium]|jgi:hypothetical protein
MPAHKIYLEIFAKNKPKLSDLFKCLERRQIIEVKAEIKKDKARWRPEGENKYGLLIYSIELIYFSDHSLSRKDFEKDIGFVPKYKIVAKLVSMNGDKNEFPEDFCYPSKGMKNKVELYMFGRKAVLVYEEYLTL